MFRRVNVITAFADPKRGVFSVERVPKDVTWGPTSAFNNMSAVLCLKGTNRPITVWIVGELNSSWFSDRDGEPAARVTVTVVPLRKDVRRICAEHIRCLSEPKTSSELKALFSVSLLFSLIDSCL